MITKRNQARADKDWALADQIRDELLEMDIVCEDQSDNARGWRRRSLSYAEQKGGYEKRGYARHCHN